MTLNPRLHPRALGRKVNDNVMSVGPARALRCSVTQSGGPHGIELFVKFRHIAASAVELTKVNMSLFQLPIPWHTSVASAVAVALTLGTCVSAGAQTAKPQAAALPARASVPPSNSATSAAPETPSPDTVVSAADGSGATPDGSDSTRGSKLIAPPSSSASAGNIAKAKETANVAALTPILPSPANPLRPAFQLYAEVDLPVLGLGLVFATARLFRLQKAYCSPRCDPHDLNSFDRSTAGFWSPPWSTASDFGLYGIAAAAATLLVADEGVVEALNDSVVIAESALSATALASVLTLAAGRPRPFMYGDKAPLSTRESADGSLSFVSSHASVTFAIATSTFMASRRLHSSSQLPYLVLGLGGAIASFVATARVMAGKHFITDAVNGAIVGSAVGVLIPSLHSSPVKVVPVVSDTQRGFGISGVF